MVDAFPDPFRSPATCASGRADTLAFDRRHASGDSDAVLALARSETVPRLCILAILLFLRRARIVIGDALLLRPLQGGTPVVVLCPVSAEASIIISWHRSSERRCHWRPPRWPDLAAAVEIEQANRSEKRRHIASEAIKSYGHAARPNPNAPSRQLAEPDAARTAPYYWL